MKALILAAGRGTRLLPFTRHTPKPLFTIGGQPVLALVLERLRQAGCKAVVINTHHLHARVEAVAHARDYGMALQTVHEPEILGTGGAIRNVAAFWSDGPLLVVNADIVSDIDLAALWHCHRRDGHPVTMAMHDHSEFNSVTVDGNDFVMGFGPGPITDGAQRRMAFTGIHVLERQVLDFLPPSGPAHIIDAYTRMIQAGVRIKAHRVRDHYWRDIGTPAAYQKTVYEQMAPAAFAAAFGSPPPGPILRQPLQGDGSERRWYRLTAGGKNLILADHGIRTAVDARQEVDAFVDIGRHLRARGAAIPRIHSHDAFAGLVFLEDLGDCHLQVAVRQRPADEVPRRYRQVIDQWLTMAIEGARGFDTDWTYQSACYDRPLILERECRYFMEAFIQNYMGLAEPYADLAAEFEHLADHAIADGCIGFMHRDLQSRNIMVRQEGIGFIDFQGGRLGPLQYDLASLLIDPYVALPLPLQESLLAYAAQAFHARTGAPEDRFRRGYVSCAITRNLQILGAFAHLTQVKGKPYFASYIPDALAALRHRLAAPEHLHLPRLTTLVARIALPPRTKI